MLVASFLFSSRAEAFETIQITSYSSPGFRLSFPAISKGKVVWYAHPTSGSLAPNYFVYDIASGQTTQITSYSGAPNFRMSYPAISNGKVAWYAHPTSGSLAPNYFVYDIATGQTTQITSYSGVYYQLSYPSISDGKVAWYAHPTSNTLVPNYYVYDIATGRTTQISNYGPGGSFRVGKPAISNGKVVWCANPTSSTQAPNYYVYDIASGQTTQITSYSGVNFQVSDPAISNGKVTWYAHPTSILLIPNYYVYDIASGQTTQITSYSGGGNFRLGMPSIGDGKVAWYAHPDSSTQVPNYYVYDISTRQTTQITSYSGSTLFDVGGPAVADGEIVWYANPTSIIISPNYYIALINQRPTDIALSNSTVLENQPSGTPIGAFDTTDPDNTGNSFAYALVSGSGSADNASFVISGNTLLTAVSFNHETKSTCSVRVRTTDPGGRWYEKALTVDVQDVNEAPTEATLSNLTLAENQPVGTSVGTLSTTDPDGANTFTYTLVSGAGSTDNAAFTISGNALLTVESFNYEAKSLLNIRIRTTDQDGLWHESAFTIQLADLVETPFDVIDFTSDCTEGFTIRWNCEAGYSYQVACSETLYGSDWEAIGPAQIARQGESTMAYTDSTAIGRARKFYKVVRTAME